jgi:hypothetical protein
LEHCKARLDQFKDVPGPDSLYCSMAMLDGYEKLFRKVYRFYVEPSQVMIDESGKVRVWVNQNFAENQAEDLQPNHTQLMGRSEEYDMVNDIMSMVFNSIDESEEPEELKFRDFFEKRRASYGDKVGFGEARNIIFDYSRISQI